MMTLTQLTALYPTVPLRHSPPGCKNKPLTGRIPIAFYSEHEAEITAARKAVGKTRVVFRGPRRTCYAEDTLRKDAVSAVIYSR